MAGKDLVSLLETLSPVLVSCSHGENFPAFLHGVTSHSGKVEKDDLFCAVEGASADGHDYIPQALERGAKVIVHTHGEGLPGNVTAIKVRDSHFAWALCCAFFCGFPAEKLDLYAVTGTNGKTSIAFMTKKLLELGKGEKTGLVSTVEYDCGTADSLREGVRTTPDAMLLQEFFGEMVKNHCRNCVMEASSHGLHQHRMGNARYAGAVFTNLTGDHLDYHGTMEAYFQAKKLLFTEHVRENAPCIINGDDPWGKRLAEELKEAKKQGSFPGKVIVLSRNDPEAEAFFRVQNLSAAGGAFTLSFQGKEYEIHSRLIGLHNLYNTAQAFLLAVSAGTEGKKAVQILEEENIAPPGRLESFLLPSGAHAFVDYAHTDDALARVLEALSPLKGKGRLITLFGCGGDRDRTKRPRMALAASTLSDVVMVTSDNPRSEDPCAIMEEIEKGFPAAFPYMAEPDRRKAIEKVLSLAEEEDIVLLAGKGHENYQEIKGIKHHFDDREELKRFIAEHGKG